MADIALITANKAEVVQSFEQLTAPAIEAIVAGAPVRIDTATGKFTNANATTLAEAKAYGLAVRTVAAGEALTAVRRGILDGFDLSGLNFDALLYLSNTDGRIADVNGTITSIMGRVIPGFAVSTGITADKLLYVDFASAQGASILAENRVLIFSELLAASVDKHVFIADRPYEVVLIKEIHSVVGGAVAAVRPRKILAASTAAPGDAAGANVKELTTANIDLTAAINTTQTPTLTATPADLQVADGDKIALDFSGTLTGLVGAIVITLEPR